MIMEGQDDNTNVGDKNRPLSSDGRKEVRYFWDGGLLANTPLRQTCPSLIDIIGRESGK